MGKLSGTRVGSQYRVFEDDLIEFLTESTFMDSAKIKKQIEMKLKRGV